MIYDSHLASVCHCRDSHFVAHPRSQTMNSGDTDEAAAAAAAAATGAGGAAIDAGAATDNQNPDAKNPFAVFECLTLMQKIGILEESWFGCAKGGPPEPRMGDLENRVFGDVKNGRAESRVGELAEGMARMGVEIPQAFEFTLHGHRRFESYEYTTCNRLGLEQHGTGAS